MNGTTLFERMRQDHRRVLERVDALEHAARPMEPRRGRARVPNVVMRDVVALLKDQFATHMAAEDEVLFPALLRALPQTRATLDPLRAEHEELRSMLHRLECTLGESPGRSRNEEIAIQVRDLADLLRIHVRKEEAVALSVAERVMQPHEIEAVESRMRARVEPFPEPSPAGFSMKGNLR